MSSSPSSPSPISLKGDQESLTIEWSDGITHRLSWRRLRDNCPCASCRKQRDEPPPLFQVLKPEEAAPLRATGMRPLGNYAYHIDFSDGHNTGIYSIDLMRELGERFAGHSGPAGAAK